MLDFIDWYLKETKVKRVISIRDILCWVTFMNETYLKIGRHESYIHGASMVLLDGLGSIFGQSAIPMTKKCIKYLINQVIYSYYYSYYLLCHLF